MTNADVSLMAMKDIVEPMVNPFTGNIMTDDEKGKDRQYISTWNAFHDQTDEFSFLNVKYLVFKNREVLNPANWGSAE